MIDGKIPQSYSARSGGCNWTQILYLVGNADGPCEILPIDAMMI